MGIVYNKPTSSVLPNTCDLLLEKVDKNAEKYDIELVDDSLTEDPSKEQPKEASPKLVKTPQYYAEAYAASDYVRFAEFLIDYAIIDGISFLIFKLFGIDDGRILASTLSIVVFFVYYFAMEAIFSRTIGKFILGLKTVELDGKKPGILLTLFRTLCRFVPFEALSCLFGDGWYHHQYVGHWHDKWSDTYVISLKKVRENI